jgi:hypothetical protein
MYIMPLATNNVTIVFVTTMSQSLFKLDENNIWHMKALRYIMGKAYSQIHSDLHLDDYQSHLKDIDPKDSAAVVNAIAKARATFKKDIRQEQWPKICDSFEKDTWKVNISS